jgi:predicted extracellular nuclease
MVDSIRLDQIGRYTSGIFNESAAEIPAYDPETQRLFVVNGNDATVDVLDLSNPSNPTFIKAIDLTPFGANPNSVAVKNGIVAVAIEAEIAQDPGRVEFFDTDGNLLSQVSVGALPDMLTFTPDGKKVLLANEGEPSDDYTTDPEGSVAIIDISGGAENLTDADVTTAGFADFNDQKEALTEEGVRIFGPDVSTEDPDDTVSVAQDLEPEYIAVTPDSETAFVSLQENNALAKVDINASKVTEILPLGFKDYNTSPSLETFFFEEEELPVLGDTEVRGEILLGGFSGLYFEGVDSQSGNLQFVTHIDRGPDAGTDEEGNRVFLLPELQPQLVRLELDPQSRDLEITERIFLTKEDGTPLTGLPNLPELDPDTPVNEAGESLEFDPETETTVGEYLYIQEDLGGGSDKIGDAVALNENGEFLVIERDSNTGEDSLKNIYRIDLKEATNVNDLPEGTLKEGETLESLSPEELAERGIQPVSKELYADLAQLGYTFTDKPEGLALVDPTTVAVINDNDFGESDIPIGLGLVSLNNTLDPSDEDGAINIRNAPVLGMYQPDGIAAYEADDGETYIVTANEGDAREYIIENEQGNETETFVEEARVADLTLDPEAFPNAAELQQEENLGRLKVTTTRGDTDGDGEFEELYAFGGRSFSIWDTEGNLVFDSGSDFERITAEQIPNFFNSDNDENSFDTRSDDKGPEPEGVVIGTVSGRDYAFIGLERIGGVMVYDITEPTSADFVQYINTRDFEGDPEAGTAGNVAPEGLEFIPAEASPTGIPLLAVAYEVSGSTAVFEVTTPISAIQGEGHISLFADNPYDDVEETNEQVVTTGIVTAIDTNGFYLQDPQGDGDLPTADGIFVFTDEEPTVSLGDELRVEGTVTEFVPGGLDTNNLSITQITDPTITQRSQGNELPAPVVIGEDRIPPDRVIDDDGLASYDPTADGIDFYESLEGMLVTVDEAQVVGPTDSFDQIFVLSNSAKNATSLSERGTINIDPDDFNPERIQLQVDDGILPGFAAPQVDVNAQLGDITGVVGYSFGNYEVNVTEPFEPIEASELEPEVTNLVRTEDQLTVATYNVLNLDPNDEDGDEDIAGGQFEQIAAQIVNNLQTPDIIALQEIQDNDGSVESDVTAADETLSLLVEQIEEIGGVTYEFIDNPFIGDDTSGGQPGGNIRTAYLYNPDRVEFVEGSLDTVIEPQNQQTDPTNPFFNSRLPLVATFTFNDEEITLINNHFSSKGGSAPLFGQIQPSVELQEDPDVNGSLDERREQANAVAEYVEDILAADPDAKVSVLGDLNEFEFISPLEILEGEDDLLINLTKTLSPDERYSYIFEGNSQSLDHILVNPNLAGEVETEGVEDIEVLDLANVEFDAVHINAEFADQASDHEPLVARFDLGQTMAENFLI